MGVEDAVDICLETTVETTGDAVATTQYSDPDPDDDDGKGEQGGSADYQGIDDGLDVLLEADIKLRAYAIETAFGRAVRGFRTARTRDQVALTKRFFLADVLHSVAGRI